MIIDIHTHHPAPYPEGLVDVSALVAGGEEPRAFEGQLYSVGIHPWNTVDTLSPELLEAVARVAERADVAAIGEAGLDAAKGGPMFRQMQVFRWCIDLSERLCKPLIIHSVKADDMVVALRRELNPRQRWLVHGFRKKPEAAATLLRAGIWLSFGEHFNADTVRSVPADRILAETDCSELPIDSIIEALGEARDITDMAAVAAANAKAFLLPE